MAPRFHQETVAALLLKRSRISKRRCKSAIRPTVFAWESWRAISILRGLSLAPAKSATIVSSGGEGRI
jgi:hypothetical protein